MSHLDTIFMELHGYTPLYYAIARGDIEACQFLVSRGAMVNGKNNQGSTLLSRAVCRQKVEFVALLLEYGANVAEKIVPSLLSEHGQSERTILEYAVQLGDECIKKLLIQQIAKMDYLHLNIRKDDRALIETNDSLNAYFCTCSQELVKMNDTKFYNSVSILNILSENIKIISGYAKNEELLKALEKEDCENKFPIYSASLRKRFYAEVKKQRLRGLATEVLNDLLDLGDPFRVISQKILSYLADKDLKFLIM